VHLIIQRFWGYACGIERGIARPLHDAADLAHRSTASAVRESIPKVLSRQLRSFRLEPIAKPIPTRIDIECLGSDLSRLGRVARAQKEP
jgi:hypothetical protein